MKAYDKEYYDLFEKFTNIKKALEEQVDLQSEKFNDWYDEKIIGEFATLYDWTDREFTTTNDDSEDLESMIDDLKFYKCDTFADFSLMYMSQYVDKLKDFIGQYKSTKEE